MTKSLQISVQDVDLDNLSDESRLNIQKQGQKKQKRIIPRSAEQSRDFSQTSSDMGQLLQHIQGMTDDKMLINQVFLEDNLIQSDPEEQSILEIKIATKENKIQPILWSPNSLAEKNNELPKLEEFNLKQPISQDQMKNQDDDVESQQVLFTTSQVLLEQQKLFFDILEQNQFSEDIILLSEKKF